MISGARLHWANWVEGAVLLLGAPFLMFPTVRPRWTIGVLVVLIVWWLLRWALRREPWPLTPFNGALLLFALTIPEAIRVSVVPEFTIPKACGLILGLAVFRAVAWIGRGQRGLVGALLLLCLLGLAMLVVGGIAARWSGKVSFLSPWIIRLPQQVIHLPELAADAVNPNQIAGMLTFYLPLSLALTLGWPYGQARWRRIPVLLIALAFLTLVVGALLLTQSRSGWIGGTVGVLGLLTLAGLSAPRRWEQILGMALPLLTVGIITALLLHIGPERVGELLNGGEDSIEKAVGVINMAGRVEIWNRALYIIQDFPLTGCGLGTFRRVVWMLYPLFTVPPNTDISHAHNIFLQTALDLGIPGLIAYLALLVIAGAICWGAARRGDPFTRPIAIGLASGLLALHAYGMTDALALGSKPAIIFWFALGLVAALENIRLLPTTDVV